MEVKIIRHFSRREYFVDLLKRLETNYDLRSRTIDVDTQRLKDLEQMDQNKIIAGRTVAEIVKRFKKKLKDPRDDYKGKKNVKIIKDFLNIKIPLQKTERVIIAFFQ